MYEYHGFVSEVYDGDTITVDIDLGFYIHIHNQKFRLLYINAPEVRGSEREKGLISRDALREKILEKNIVIKTLKDSKDKYGRWLCEVWVDNTNINQWMLDNQYAVVYEADLNLKMEE